MNGWGCVCGVRLHFFIEKATEANRDRLAKRYLDNVFQAKVTSSAKALGWEHICCVR